MNRLTITQLQVLKGVSWADQYLGPVTGPNILLWAAIDELASTAELFIAIEDLEEVAPRTVQVLEGGQDHFVALATPRPYALELLLLKLERHRAGLDPDGQ